MHIFSFFRTLITVIVLLGGGWLNTVEPIRDLDVVMDIAEYLKGKSDRDYVMFMFGIYTGLRISDILKFRVRDVRDKDAVYIREKKTGKEKRFPINTELKPVIKDYVWTTERGKTDKQKKTLGSITFSYFKLKCVVAVSIAVDTVTLDVFERTLTSNIAEAMVKALEKAIIAGEGASANQPEGILSDAVEVVEGQKVEIAKGKDITFKNLCDAEGKLPAAYESAEWYMTKSTYFNQIAAMTDTSGQPIARVNAGVSGKPEYRILGRPVNFVSSEYMSDFSSTVSADTVVAFMFRMEDYILNTNLNVTVKRYEDHETDDQVTKAIMMADGKVVDNNSLVEVIQKNL